MTTPAQFEHNHQTTNTNMKLNIIKKIVLKLKTLINEKKLSKTIEVVKKENALNQLNEDIITENLHNEAIEAALAHLIASTPSSSPSTMCVTISSGTSFSFYSGCQVAGPQLA